MPIHLPPVSRRAFLLRTLTAGAGLLLAPGALAARRREDRHSWALWSDTHLAADRSLKARGICMAEHFEAVAAEVLALDRRPAGLLVNGDLAYNTGQEGDYALLADLLVPLRRAGVPVHLALGNHDHRERFWNGIAKTRSAKRPVRDKHAGIVKASRANWFLLDSLEATNSTPGLLGPDQLAWLGKALDSNRSKPALVMVHHNPQFEPNSNNGLKDTEALLDVLRPRRQVKALIFGHTHVWASARDTSGIHLINLPAVAYVFRENVPSGWAHARLERDGMSLELRCVDPFHPAHGETVRYPWRA